MTLAKRKKAPAAPRRRAAPKRKAPRRKAGGFGGLGLKEMLGSIAVLSVGKVVVSKLAPGLPFQRPLSAIAGGGIAAVTGLPGKRLINYGIADAGSDIVADLVNGGSFNFGGLTQTGASKGYDV